MSKLTESISGLLLRLAARRVFVFFAAALLYVLDLAFGWWSYVEPGTFWLLVVALGLPAGARYLLAKRQRYDTTVNEGEAIIALRVGNDVSETIVAHFGRSADQIVDAEKIVGHGGFLDAEAGDFKKVVQALRRAILSYNGVIHLVLAGPIPVALQVGMMLGPNKRIVIPYLRTREGLTAVEPIGPEWFSE